MEIMPRLYLFILVINIPAFGNCQSLYGNWFVRTPQIVNFNLNTSAVSFLPVVSTGFGLSHRSKYIEAASFITQGNTYGYYTFFGSTLKSKELDPHWKLNVNWFGEVAFVPQQSESKKAWTQTVGICFFINQQFKWGNIGIPLCVGIAHSQGHFSLNSRTIVNFSIPIK
jgi:hypothetical protein